MADSRIYRTWQQRYVPSAAAPSARIKNRLNAIISLGDEIAENNRNALRANKAQFNDAIHAWVEENPERIEDVLPVILALHPTLLNEPAGLAAVAAPANQVGNSANAAALLSALRRAPAPTREPRYAFEDAVVRMELQLRDIMVAYQGTQIAPQLQTAFYLVTEGAVKPQNQSEINSTMTGTPNLQGLNLAQRARLAYPFLFQVSYVSAGWPRAWRMLLVAKRILDGTYDAHFLLQHYEELRRRLANIRESHLIMKKRELANKRCEARNIIRVATLNNRSVANRTIPRNVFRTVMNMTHTNTRKANRTPINFNKYKNTLSAMKANCETRAAEISAMKQEMAAIYDTFDIFE